MPPRRARPESQPELSQRRRRRRRWAPRVLLALTLVAAAYTSGRTIYRSSIAEAPSETPGTADPDRSHLPPGPIDPGGGGLPDGYADELVLAVPAPTTIAFAGRSEESLLIATQPGQLYRWGPGGPELVLDLLGRTCSRVEQGMLGLAPHPEISANGYLYVYYTVELDGDCFNRVARFTIGTGGKIDPGSEIVLIDRIPSIAGNHNAGDLQFGKDGLLYVGVGDSGCGFYDRTRCHDGNPNSRLRNVLLGKVLRIHPDGSVPEDNPFAGEDSARCNTDGFTEEAENCAETFLWGLRNPFRLAFDPNAAGTRFRVNDPGQDRFEEINEAVPGADYGWSEREGFCANQPLVDCRPAPEGMTDPVFSYNHGPDPDGCSAITGGAFVPDGVWPGMDGVYLFADFGCGSIFELVESGGRFEARPFAGRLGVDGVVDLEFGPYGKTQALYYTTYAGGGQVRRIVHTGRNGHR